MISRVDFDNYNKAVAELVNEASKATSDQIKAWARLHPDASVAEYREFAKETMDGMCQVFGEAASGLAAQWYDVQAMASGVTLSPAITEVTYSPEQIKKVSHYQAKKLLNGDIEGFADSCAEYVENNVKQSLNDTILSNAARDKEAGVRFARVPTGSETCTFCSMLASRGAVYHSRKTAGEQSHYHRRCDCKIVPGFEENPDAEIVEGYIAQEYYDLWKKFEEIDKLSIPKAQKDAIKRAWSDSLLNKRSGKLTGVGLIEKFEEGLNSAKAQFAKHKTPDSYNQTINKYINEIGKAYNVNISGLYQHNSNNKYIYAIPEAEEIWAVCKAKNITNNIVFIPPDRSLIPDAKTSIGYIEIKTPSSNNKVSNRLAHASDQLESVSAIPKIVYLSLIKIPNEKEAIEVAKKFVEQKKLDIIYVIRKNGNIEEIKAAIWADGD